MKGNRQGCLPQSHSGAWLPYSILICENSARKNQTSNIKLYASDQAWKRYTPCQSRKSVDEITSEGLLLNRLKTGHPRSIESIVSTKFCSLTAITAFEQVYKMTRLSAVFTCLMMLSLGQGLIVLKAQKSKSIVLITAGQKYGGDFIVIDEKHPGKGKPWVYIGSEETMQKVPVNTASMRFDSFLTDITVFQPQVPFSNFCRLTLRYGSNPTSNLALRTGEFGGAESTLCSAFEILHVTSQHSDSTLRALNVRYDRLLKKKFAKLKKLDFNESYKLNPYWIKSEEAY